MQKKLYFLDEQEKNRILNLHENRTQNQYLLTEAINRDTFNNKIRNICKSNLYGQPTISSAEVEKISNALSNVYLKPGSGYMNNDSLDRMSQKLAETKNIVNFCLVLKKFEETTKRDLMGELSRFVYTNNTWDLSVRLPLDKLIKVSEEIKQKSDAAYMINPTDTIVGWDKYPCVPQQKGAIDYESRQTPTDTTNWIQVGQFVYSKEGKKFKDGDNKNQTDYSCETEFQAQQPATNYQKVAGGYVGNTFSGNVVKQLRDSVGITGEGGLDQNDINQLYAKISALPNKQ